ncbi:MAG TPA: hypothetical protein EYN73_08715 [Chromatiaceae bacterium]|jgi:predicted RND superfamily exporter protein|nr:hypothetical protein [Chromatiaceae bacterium]HIN81977.1 hypothetical protein [Chromatiales bacterium]HIA09128.1 hypothetical protein [Chromatiaceae bacterium]HIB83390.1 hypothetical protein [Chromatiaceae bacterium]HIO14434.1 hypothetical protein [Chromatiales bacterium]
MVELFATQVVRWRFVLVVVMLGLVALAASGGRFLTLTSDYRVFFGEDNPQLNAFENLQNTYTKNDNILIVVAPKNHKVFTRDVLSAVEEITDAAWQTPYSLRVDSITNFQHTRGEDDDLIVESLVEDAQGLFDNDLERIKNIALNEPLLVHRLISTSGDVTGINVTIQVPEIDVTKEIPEVVGHVRKYLEGFRAEHPDLEIYLTGTVMMNNAFPEAAKADAKSLVPMMFLVVVVTLWLLLRSISGVFATVVIVISAIGIAMGLTGWVGMTLTPPTGSVPTIILTLAVADCVHVLSSFLHEMGLGRDKKAAMIESIRLNFQPITLTSLTTAIGFLSMNFSDAPPFRDVGNMVATGIIAAWILSLVLLPALMTILPVRARKATSLTSTGMQNLGEFVIRNSNMLFWSILAMATVLALMIPKNEMNDQFVEYFDESIEFRSATDFVTDNLTGIYTIDYSLSSGEAGGLNNPEFLLKVEEFANWYREQAGVIHVNVFTDIMKRLNMNLHGDDEFYYSIPEERDLAAQYLLLYEMSLPYGLDLNNQIDIDKSATRMNVTVENLTTNELLNLETLGRQWLAENAPESMQTEGASPAIMFANIGKRNMRSMLSGTVLALIFISLILIVAFRSVSIGLISLIPNLLPAAAAFGVWAMIIGEVGLALSVVVSMTLGIVVDDTVHFLSKYLRARREKGLGTDDALRYAFSTVGTALWVTTIVLVAGFSVLAFSTFKMNSGMGLLTAITIALALIIDFLFLPPLLMKLQENE